jgi:hypothetical protein
MMSTERKDNPDAVHNDGNVIIAKGLVYVATGLVMNWVKSLLTPPKRNREPSPTGEYYFSTDKLFC